MADTIREQVLAAFFTVINTAVPAAIPNTGVERNRSRPIPINSDSFVILFDGPQLITSDETCNTRYTLDVEAEGYARADTDLLLGPAVNQLYGQLVKAAVSDHSLGSLSIDVQEGSLQDVYIDDEASKPTGAFAITFSIQFSTVGGDPFTIGV